MKSYQTMFHAPKMNGNRQKNINYTVYNVLNLFLVFAFCCFAVMVTKSLGRIIEGTFIDKQCGG